MKLYTIILGVAIYVMQTLPANAAMLDHSFVSSTNQGAQVGLTYDGLAQTFTVGLDGLFDSAELYLSHANPTPTSDLTISLYNTMTGAPNSVIASVSVNSADVSSTPGNYLPLLVDFSFANYAVNVGDILAIGIFSTDSGYAWNAGVDEFATYAGGERYHDFAGGAVTWDPLSNWDFSLNTYVSVPEPASLALLLIGLAGFNLRKWKAHNN